MKKTFFTLLILFSASVLDAQIIKEVFIDLARFGRGKLYEDDRKNMIFSYEMGRKGVQYGFGKAHYYITNYEPEQGFLTYSRMHPSLWRTTVTYWEMSSEGMLIRVQELICDGTCDCEIDFIYKGNSLTRLNPYNVLPTINFADFMDVDQMKNDGVDIQKELELFYSRDLIYDLQTPGENIVVTSQYQKQDMSEELKKYDLGSTLDLVWNDGIFIKKKKNQ